MFLIIAKYIFLKLRKVLIYAKILLDNKENADVISNLLDGSKYWTILLPIKNSFEAMEKRMDKCLKYRGWNILATSNC